MHLNRVLWTVTLLVLACSAELATAADLPSDLCSLLPSEVVSKTLGRTDASPEKTVAPKPFRNTNEGTDCRYGGVNGLLFRIYVDPSPSESTDLFARLKAFYGTGSTSVSGIGDEAYLDKDQGLHVRKGKIRYFLGGAGTPKQKNDLAASVAGKL